MKSQKKKLSRKALLKKYPQKQDLGEEVTRFAGRVFLIIGLFIVVALSRDIFYFVH